jgi:hypothetical protein
LPVLCTPPATVSLALWAPLPSASLTESRRPPPSDERLELDLGLADDAALRLVVALDLCLVALDLRFPEELLRAAERLPLLDARVFGGGRLLGFGRELDDARLLALEPEPDFPRERELLWAIPTLLGRLFLTKPRLPGFAGMNRLPGNARRRS